MRKQRRMQEEKEHREKKEVIGRKRRRNEKGKAAGFWMGMLLVFLFAFAGTLALLIADERCAMTSDQPTALERTADLLESMGARTEQEDRRIE